MQLPSSLPANSVYYIWADNGTNYSTPFIINQPTLAWNSVNNMHGGEPLSDDGYFSDPPAYPGEQMSLFGQNLSQGDGSQTYVDQSWVYFFNASDGSFAGTAHAVAQAPDSSGANALDVNPYKIDFNIPSSLAPGGTPQDYYVEVYNGHGGLSAMSNWIEIQVAPAPAANPTVFNMAKGIEVWQSTYGIAFAPPIYIPLPSDPAQMSINAYAVDAAIAGAWLASLAGPYAYTILDLPPGIIQNTPITNSLDMHPDVHLVGAGNDPNDPAAGTTIEDEPGAGLSSVVSISNGDAFSDMYLAANGGLSDPTEGRVMYDYQSGYGLTLDDVTVDARSSTGGQACWDVLFGNTVYRSQFLNCTFVGRGLSVPGGNDMIVDNCHFLGCGERGASAAAIYCTEGESDASVTRTTVQSIIDNITSPGGDVAFDAACRLFIAQGSFGFSYIGDSETADMYDPASIDNNGGEQVLFEGHYTSAFYQGNIGSGSIVTGFTYDPTTGTNKITFATGISVPVDYTVTITAGPGMGESRVILDSAGDLNSPWAVMPNAGSDFIITLATAYVSVFQNSIAGDGALSLLNNGPGVDAGGLDIAIDDNDISGMPFGIQFQTAGSASYPPLQVFGLIARNSLHDDTIGISIWVGYSNTPPESTIIGNVFRDNSISGPAAPANESTVTGVAGIVIGGTAGMPGTADYDPAATLMNIFDRNAVVDYQVGIAFSYTGGTSGSAGVVGTILSYDFFSSNGEAGSYGLTDYFFFGTSFTTDTDPQAYYYYYGNTWQNFWDANTPE